MYRTRINSFYELPEEKRPSRNLWDKPYQLQQFLDEVFEVKRKNKDYEFNPEDVE